MRYGCVVYVGHSLRMFVFHNCVSISGCCLSRVAVSVYHHPLIACVLFPAYVLPYVVYVGCGGSGFGGVDERWHSAVHCCDAQSGVGMAQRATRHEVINTGNSTALCSVRQETESNIPVAVAETALVVTERCASCWAVGLSTGCVQIWSHHLRLTRFLRTRRSTV